MDGDVKGMTIHTNRFSPDTCSCIIEYSWDDAVPEASRTHSVDNVVSKCAAHTSLSNPSDVWNTIQVENPRKNHAIKEILDRAPSSVWDLEDDGVTRKFKKGIEATFSFNGTAPNRIITITVTGIVLTTAQKNAVQTFLDNKFSPGKVTLINE